MSLESTRTAVDRVPRERTGPLSGIRVADFCWMGVGSCATRLLADFGAEVIRIEDRKRLDTPRRLPIYKGEARTYGEEDAEPRSEQGRPVQQLQPQQARRDHQHAHARRGANWPIG